MSLNNQLKKYFVRIIGIVLTAGYMLWAFQRIFFGQVPERWKSLADISRRELAMPVPYPSLLIHPINASLNHLVDFIQRVGTGLAVTN